ncbi:hypothetical protein T4B_1158 [Trichinella pseudospiralis]|uniref:Uncharacterized protein n=1 Tax=Trichinella pseudospiralis TaxID=6337 RepID=A0A0V1G168_TRIPS|nr:hypothetical protein T4B_1158 [Trichinella pseudospiralis]
MCELLSKNHCISCLSAITSGKLPSPNGTKRDTVEVARFYRSLQE